MLILIAPWIAARRFTDIQSAFDKHGVCWGRYQTVSQLVQADPACSDANPMFSALEQPGVGRYLMPGIPLEFSAVARAPGAPAPMLGQHTEEVMLDVLGPLLLACALPWLAPPSLMNGSAMGDVEFDSIS